MQITITARSFGLTKAIRDTIEISVEKLNKYFDHIVNVHVTLNLQGSRNVVDLNLQAGRNNLNAQAEAMDMYLAINEAVDNMEAQIKKLKDKVTDKQRPRIKEDPRFVYDNLYERDAEKAKRVVKTKRMVADTMSVEEAIDHIEKINEDFLVFRNEETDRINVLVQKDKNTFKVIES
jgi:putative sigma-54 modulation protein